MMISEDERKKFLEGCNADYARLRTDPQAWQEELEERALWDCTLMDGLKDDPPYPPEAVLTEGEHAARENVACGHQLKRVREEEIARAYTEAAADPLFMADLEECMRDFAAVDADANRFLDIEPHDFFAQAAANYDPQAFADALAAVPDGEAVKGDDLR